MGWTAHLDIGNTGWTAHLDIGNTGGHNDVQRA